MVLLRSRGPSSVLLWSVGEGAAWTRPAGAPGRVGGTPDLHNYKDTLQRTFLLWSVPLFTLGNSVLSELTFPDEIARRQLGKVRALQPMGYLNPLWLRCWRRARAADHPLQGSEARAANLLTVAGGLRTQTSSLLPPRPRVAMRRKQSHELSRTGGGFSHALPPFPPAFAHRHAGTRLWSQLRSADVYILVVA